MASGQTRWPRLTTWPPQEPEPTIWSTDFALEDESVMAEAALALVEGDLTGRIALSQLLLAELGRARAFPAVSERAGGDG